LAQGGGLALRSEVGRELAMLWNGAGSANDIAQRWAKERAAERLWFAAQLAGEEAASSAAQRRGPLALTPAPDFHKLAQWLLQAGRVREQLRTPLRPDLSILELLMAWRELAPRARRA
jgi:DNA polymerase-3 subunit delta'